MLNIILPYIDQYLTEFAKNYGLAELVTETAEENAKTFPAVYLGSGDYQQIELEQQISYHRIDGSMNVVPTTDNAIGCSRGLDITYPMVLVGYLNRDYGCDQSSSDTIANGIAFKLQQIKFPKALRATLKAWSIELNLKSINTRRNDVWNQEYTNVPMQADFNQVYFSISYDLFIKADSSCLNLLDCNVDPISFPAVPCTPTPSPTQVFIKPAISLTKSNLDTLISENLLVKGQPYEINDYLTKYALSDTAGNILTPFEIKEGPIAPIIVIADSENTLQPIAFQPSNPYDVIQYDINESLCEDGITARPGTITMRHDTLWNNKAGYDFRVVLFRRYRLDLTAHAAWSSLTTYARNALVVSGDSLWVSNVSSNLTHTPGADSYWTRVLESVSTMYHLYAKSVSMVDFTLTADTTQFKDMYTWHNTSDDTFSQAVRNFHIGRNDKYILGRPVMVYNNIVIQIPNNSSFVGDSSFDTECFNANFILTTTANSFLANRFGPLCGNIIGRNMSGCDVWGRSASLVIGTGMTRLVGSFTRTVFGNGCMIISAQSTLSARFVASVVNANIYGNITNCTVGIGLSRIFMERPMGEIHLLSGSLSAGCHIGCHAGNYQMVAGRMGSDSTSIDLFFSKTFTGLSGSGAIGSVTLDDSMAVPNGYRIDMVTTEPSGLIYGVGAILNVGYTGNSDAALNNTTGDIATLAAGITRTNPLDTRSAADTNIIIASVSGAAITAGTLRLYIRLVRI